MTQPGDRQTVTTQQVMDRTIGKWLTELGQQWTPEKRQSLVTALLQSLPETPTPPAQNQFALLDVCEMANRASVDAERHYEDRGIGGPELQTISAMLSA